MEGNAVEDGAGFTGDGEMFVMFAQTIKKIIKPIYNAFCAVLVERIACGVYDWLAAKFSGKNEGRD